MGTKPSERDGEREHLGRSVNLISADLAEGVVRQTEANTQNTQKKSQRLPTFFLDRKPLPYNTRTATNHNPLETSSHYRKL